MRDEVVLAVPTVYDPPAIIPQEETPCLQTLCCATIIVIWNLGGRFFITGPRTENASLSGPQSFETTPLERLIQNSLAN